LQSVRLDRSWLVVDGLVTELWPEAVPRTP
jgi:hypothetical protein